MNKNFFSIVVAAGIATGAGAGVFEWGAEPAVACGKVAMPNDWREIIPDTRLSFTPPETAKKSGFMLFNKHYMEDTTPYTVGMEHELVKELRCFGSPGEYEPVNFLIRSLRDITGLQVKVSALKSCDNTIAADNIDVRFLLALPFKDARFDRKYTMKHEIMVRRDKIDIPFERTERCWLTVFIPPNTPEGIYTGQVTVSAGAQLSVVPLKVRVFPIKLASNPNVERGMYIGGHQKSEAMRRKFYLDMKQHGMNTVAPCNYSAHLSWRNGGIKLDFSMLDLDIKLYKEAGFTMPVPLDMRGIQAYLANLQDAMNDCKKAGKPFPANFDVKVSSYDVSPKFTDFEAVEYKKIVKAMLEHAQRQNYPPVYFLPQEEATNKGTRIQQLKRFSQLLKECGVRTTAWSNGTWGGIDDLQDVDKDMDVRYYNFITPAIRERCKKSGDFFGIYNHGDRMMYGFFAEKVKAEGIMQWAYIFASTGKMLSNGSGYYGSGVAYVGEDGPLPSPAWERIREGCDDNRYIYTLRRLIEISADKKAAAAAQRELDSVLANIPDNTADMNKMCAALDPAQLDSWRFKLIRQILAMQKTIPSASPVAHRAAPQEMLLAGMEKVNGDSAAATAIGGKLSSLVIPYIATADFSLASPAWDKAAVTTPFVLTYQSGWKRTRAIAASEIGAIGAIEPTQSGNARVFYDKEALYVRFDFREARMDRIVANSTRRDGAVYSDDAAELFLRPVIGSDRYMQIAANSNGVLMDSIRVAENGRGRLLALDWNPAIKVLTEKGSDFWRCAMRVPFRDLGVTDCPAPGTLWRINLAREEQPAPGGEYSAWALVDRSFHEIDRWGMLFFGKIPPAMISEVIVGTPGFGANRLDVRIKNNSTADFKGTLRIKMNGKGSCPAELPVKIIGRDGTIIIPYTLSAAGDFGFNLQLFAADGKMIFSTRCQYTVPEALTMKLMNRELSGNNLQLLCGVNISGEDIGKYAVEYILSGQKYRHSDTAAFKKPGNYRITLRTASLKPGDYTVHAVLRSCNGREISRCKGSFTVSEGAF